MKFYAVIFFALLVGCGDRSGNVRGAGVPQKIVCMSSSHVAFLRELGLEDRIVYRLGNAETADLEAIAASGADLILLSGLDDERLERLGVETFRVDEWTEATPLDRAEWIVRVAEVCGAGERGRQKFAEIERAYTAQKQRAEKLAAGTGARLTVMLNAPYRGVWFVPGRENYMTALIEDAGGELVATGEGAASRPIDIEQAHLAMRRADFWLNPNHYTSIAELLADNPRLVDVPPLTRARTYNNNARTTPDGGSDFWESGVVRPDLVLRDLVAILHDTGDSLHYYRRLR